MNKLLLLLILNVFAIKPSDDPETDITIKASKKSEDKAANVYERIKPKKSENVIGGGGASGDILTYE